MIFGYTIMYVNNVIDTIAFYEKAFGFHKKFITEEGDYGELASGETTIAFASIELGQSNFKKGFIKSASNEKPYGIELTFVSNQIEQDFDQAVRIGATIYEPIVEKPWGQKVGYLRDNNGFLIEICTPIKS